jgi:hypothetical protein
LLLRNPEVGQRFIQLLAGPGGRAGGAAAGHTAHPAAQADALLHLHAQAGDAPAASIQLSRDDMVAMVAPSGVADSHLERKFKADGLVELTPALISGYWSPKVLRRARW